ncbi:c-type cytochrome [Sulfitobacter sp.]|uniref:c-type cytochrome n=1 Tax=Sulfitobacter sp. TaxID=1903071 RepID=UPI0030026B10
MSQRPHPFYRRYVRLGGIVLVLAVALVAAQLTFGSGPMTNRADWPSEFQSNGERIYFTGTSASGQLISLQGGTMHMRMSAGGCVTCHGADRKGGRLMPKFWKSAPPLTAAALFGEHANEDNDASGDGDGHGDHDSYTEDTLRRVITDGVDPAGERLDPAMPRWSMSAEDMADLIAYLKTLVGGGN